MNLVSGNVKYNFILSDIYEKLIMKITVRVIDMNTVIIKLFEHIHHRFVRQWQITFFVGAGPSAGIQVLQRILTKLNQLSSSHVLKNPLVSTFIHILQENKHSYLDIYRLMNTDQQTRTHREILTSWSLSVIKVINWPGDCCRMLDTYSISTSYLVLLKEHRTSRETRSGVREWLQTEDALNLNTTFRKALTFSVLHRISHWYILVDKGNV